MSADGISIKRIAGGSEIFDSDIETRVAVGFPLVLGAEVSGDAPVYQWYEIENGGEPVALKTGKAKTLKIGMKAADWAGVVSKTYYCEAYNKSGKVVSKTVRTPSITLWLDEAPMPASLAGMAFDAESDGIKFRAFFADSKKVYLAAEYDAVDYCNSTYTFKRLSETSAQLKITYTRGDGDGGSRKYSETGLLEADWDSGDISVFLADQSGELLVYTAQPLAGIEAPDSMPLGTVRYDASTTATFLAGGTCILNMGGRNVPAKYTYKKAAAGGSMAMLNVDLTVSKTKYTAELPLFFVKTGFADYIAYLKSGKFFETQTGTLAFPKK